MPTVTGNTFSQQQTFPIYLHGTAFPTYSSNTFSGDKFHAIGLGGTFKQDGTLPQELPVPPEQVASLHAYLSNTALQDMTLIDTPGLGSVHDEYSKATRELLARLRAVIRRSLTSAISDGRSNDQCSD